MRNSREAVKLTASDAVYETLRHKIMNNQLPGGSQLLEEEVATQLNVSRTPVRAALSKLEAEGLLHAVRRHGYRITPITVQDIHEIYQILSPLETVAAELLAEKNPNEQEVQALQECVDRMDEALQRNDLQAWADADELFHTRLVDLCGNQRLALPTNLILPQSHSAPSRAGGGGAGWARAPSRSARSSTMAPWSTRSGRSAQRSRARSTARTATPGPRPWAICSPR